MSIDIGETLRLIREAKEMRIKDVAESAGISPGFLTLVEQGRRDASMAVLMSLATSLNVPFDALILAGTDRASIHSSNSRAKRIIASVERIRGLQQELKKELEQHDGRDEKSTFN